MRESTHKKKDWQLNSCPAKCIRYIFAFFSAHMILVSSHPFTKSKLSGFSRNWCPSAFLPHADTALQNSAYAKLEHLLLKLPLNAFPAPRVRAADTRRTTALTVRFVHLPRAESTGVFASKKDYLVCLTQQLNGSPFPATTLAVVFQLLWATSSSQSRGEKNQKEPVYPSNDAERTFLQ